MFDAARNHGHAGVTMAPERIAGVIIAQRRRSNSGEGEAPAEPFDLQQTMQG
jgi:hypothetical protein